MSQKYFVDYWLFYFYVLIVEGLTTASAFCFPCLNTTASSISMNFFDVFANEEPLAKTLWGRAF